MITDGTRLDCNDGKSDGASTPVVCTVDDVELASDPDRRVVSLHRLLSSTTVRVVSIRGRLRSFLPD